MGWPTPPDMLRTFRKAVMTDEKSVKDIHAFEFSRP
jgi:hypothetical protein